MTRDRDRRRGRRCLVRPANPASAPPRLDLADGSCPPAAPIELTGIDISDTPAFAWRGVHLDVSRHFMPKNFVLKLVDLISMHKCNVLHLHLTDDQGWRVPVEAYPRLIEVGAWRRESAAGHYLEGRYDGQPHGGFYSADDLREIVGYAHDRFVDVLPEIEMPGHMLAAIAAYPELSNEETRGLIGSRQLALMRQGTLLVNADAGRLRRRMRWWRR